MSEGKFIGTWIAVFAVMPNVLGSLTYASSGSRLPSIQVEQGVIPPYWG